MKITFDSYDRVPTHGYLLRALSLSTGIRRIMFYKDPLQPNWLLNTLFCQLYYAFTNKWILRLNLLKVIDIHVIVLEGFQL